MTAEVQYGPAAASVYDSLIVGMLPLDEETMGRLRGHLTGARALELGVGTGRAALAASELAHELVGLDNSAAMLDVLRGKPLPENLSLVEADFRQPLPVAGPFDTAYATLGSLACVGSTDELTAVLRHVAEVLRPDGTLVFDYYATAAYRPLIEAHSVTIPTPHHGGETTFTVTLDDADVMTMSTRVDEDGKEPVEFSERILLVERAEVEACLAAAGFEVVEVEPSDGMQAYDWYTARRTPSREG